MAKVTVCVPRPLTVVEFDPEYVSELPTGRLGNGAGPYFYYVDTDWGVVLFAPGLSAQGLGFSNDVILDPK